MPPTFSSKYLAAPASIPHLFSCLTLGLVASQENIMQNFVNIRYIYICIYLCIYIQVRDSEGGIQKFADTTLNLLDLVLNIFVFAPKKRILPPPRITCSYGADVLSQDVLTLQWLDGSGAVKQLQVMLASVSFQHGEKQTRKLMGSNTRVFCMVTPHVRDMTRVSLQGVLNFKSLRVFVLPPNLETW